MRKFKKHVAIFLTAAMALSLVACGDKKEKTTETEGPTTTEAVVAEVIEDNYDWPTTEVPVKDDNRFTTVEGDDAMGVTFDSDVNGFVTYANGGAFEMFQEDGQLVVDIEKEGSLEHSVQIYYDGFTMARDCVYNVSFDISSTVERKVEWRVQINGGDYHAYASDLVTIGPEMQTVNMEFTMSENSDPAPRFVINMGHYEGEPELGAHTIKVDNISLFVVDGSKAEKIEGAPTPIQVKVNQIGYAPDDVKTVITTSKDDERFKIVKADTEETVYIGEYDPKLIFDPNVGSNLHRGDFSDFKATGDFKIISSPSGASYEFSIGEGLYDDIYKDVVLMLYNQRCGCELDPNISGDFAHAACHMQEATVYGDSSGKTYDVSGGWHDAGDYGRYVVPGAKTIQDLFLAYEDYGYASDEMGIPESGNGTPDLLDEARYELEWMLKMQDEATGGVYHKVTALVFPETVLAVDETDPMVLAPMSAAATGDFAAVMAKASVLYADYDADFSAKCLEASKKAYGWLEANPDAKGFWNPDEIVTGEYPDNFVIDEKLWAATELYIATGEQTYLDAINTLMADKYRTGLGWANIGSYALYDLAKAENVDATAKEAAKAKFIEVTDKYLEECKTDPFFMGLSNYAWGSNMDVAQNGEMLLMANKLSPNAEYVEYAQKHRDYIFGLNGVGYCYVTGYGENTPTGTHHRPSQVLGTTMPGMLVGGANENLEDPYAQAVLWGMPGSLCYVDNEQSFSCNEITIYWNSPLIYLMTGLENQ